MSLPFRKAALSLSAILFLTQNADASWLSDNLQNVAKKLTEQPQNNQTQQQTNQTQSQSDQTTQEETPKFNSLAEEAAYNKQKEDQAEKKKVADEQNLEKLKKEKIQKLKEMKSKFYQKYYVKETDTPDMIDAKYQNREQLFADMQKDIEAYNNENRKDRIKTDIEPLGSEIDEAWQYTVETISNEGTTYLRFGTRHISLKISIYEEYLKDAYNGYQKRQKEKADKVKQAQVQAQAQQDAKAQQALWIKENKKVRNICNAWIAKAHKMVYSLGAGDRVTYHGTYYTIQRNNANTFLVDRAIIGPFYIQKSECLPYPMPLAPSQYCQQAN